MKRAALAALGALMTLTPVSTAIASPMLFPSHEIDGFGGIPPPSISAPSWILYDESSNEVLAALNPDEIRAPASITKIMTVLIALERADQGELVTVSQRAADTGEREIGLVAGEQVTLGALLRAAMIHSANDAATAIAEHIAGTLEGFIQMMNQRAGELGMSSTRFANPHGLDAPGHQTSARDMLQLARVAMQRGDFRDIVKARVLVFPDGPEGLRVGTTTNLLLHDYEGNTGIKTGFTSQALLTYVATAERDGREIYAVILGSDGQRAHFADATSLFDYAYEDLRIYGSLTAGIPYVSSRDQPGPGPVIASARFESMAHLAAQGLTAEVPTPPIDPPELPPPPIEAASRSPAGDGHDPWGAIIHWFSWVLGP